MSAEKIKVIYITWKKTWSEQYYPAVTLRYNIIKIIKSSVLKNELLILFFEVISNN